MDMTFAAESSLCQQIFLSELTQLIKFFEKIAEIA